VRRVIAMGGGGWMMDDPVLDRFARSVLWLFDGGVADSARSWESRTSCTSAVATPSACSRSGGPMASTRRFDRRTRFGFVAGSFTPHHDAEPARRPAVLNLVASGALPAGYACDDYAALHLVEGQLREAVASKRGARAFRVEAIDGTTRETPLDVRLLT
jgi:hypothetical protein